MKSNYIIILILIIELITSSSSQGQENISNNVLRNKRIKEVTVRILIDDIACGTGFFIFQDGHIATCMHVIEKNIKELSEKLKKCLSKKYGFEVKIIVEKGVKNGK